jgi:hypothetical protein
MRAKDYAKSRLLIAVISQRMTGFDPSAYDVDFLVEGKVAQVSNVLQ